jgi:hypothetical protein
MSLTKQPQKKTLKAVLHELVERSNTDNARIRVLEQENDILKSRSKSFDQDLLSMKKYFDSSLNSLRKDIEKNSKKTMDTESTLKQLIKEIKKLATTSKIKELEALVDIYNPLKSQFMTKEEVERMIEKKLENRNV